MYLEMPTGERSVGWVDMILLAPEEKYVALKSKDSPIEMVLVWNIMLPILSFKGLRGILYPGI